jgi:hypothetical protein
MLGPKGRNLGKFHRLVREETALHAKPSYRNPVVIYSLTTEAR